MDGDGPLGAGRDSGPDGVVQRLVDLTIERQSVAVVVDVEDVRRGLPATRMTGAFSGVDRKSHEALLSVDEETRDEDSRDHT